MADEMKDKEDKKEGGLTPVSESAAKKKDIGRPGGGAGRIDKVEHTGVYPASGPLPESDAPFRDQMSWGQGPRGAQGYYDSGDSEIIDIVGKQPLGEQPTEQASASEEKKRPSEGSKKKSKKKTRK